MKALAILFGTAASFLAGAANATTIFNSFGNNAAGYLVEPKFVNGTGGPDGDSFTISGTTSISSISLELWDTTPADGGSVLLFLVPNNGVTHLPTSSGTSLSGALELGSVLDSALPNVITGPATTFSSLTNNTNIAAGTYWIVAVSSYDTTNGGTTGTSMAKWALSTTSTAGLGTAGQYFEDSTWSGGSGGSGTLNSNPDSFESSVSPDVGVFEMSIQTTPEPASLAILGAGLAGLGLSRRRRAKKSAE